MNESDANKLNGVVMNYDDRKLNMAEKILLPSIFFGKKHKILVVADIIEIELDLFVEKVQGLQTIVDFEHSASQGFVLQIKEEQSGDGGSAELCLFSCGTSLVTKIQENRWMQISFLVDIARHQISLCLDSGKIHTALLTNTIFPKKEILLGIGLWSSGEGRDLIGEIKNLSFNGIKISENSIDAPLSPAHVENAFLEDAKIISKLFFYPIKKIISNYKSNTFLNELPEELGPLDNNFLYAVTFDKEKYTETALARDQGDMLFPEVNSFIRYAIKEDLIALKYRQTLTN